MIIKSFDIKTKSDLLRYLNKIYYHQKKYGSTYTFNISSLKLFLNFLILKNNFRRSKKIDNKIKLIENLNEKYIFIKNNKNTKKDLFKIKEYLIYKLTKGIFIKNKIKNISFGGMHCAFITEDNKLYTFGKNSFGQLGTGNNKSFKTPKKINDLHNCLYVKCGYAYTFVNDSNKLYSFGAGENGRLGLNSEENYNYPKKIDLNEVSNNIECGSTHVCLLTNKNEIYSWGHYQYNGHYKYNSNNNNIDKLFPEKMEYFNDILIDKISIGPGGYHTLVLGKNGFLYGWGHNRCGQLGNKNHSNVFEEIEDFSDRVIIKKPILINKFISLHIKDIKCGWGHSMFLTYDGEVYICGRNQEGQLGINKNICPKNSNEFYFYTPFYKITNLKNIDKICCGGITSGAIDKNNIIYTWGDNSKKESIIHRKFISYDINKLILSNDAKDYIILQ